MSPSPLLPPQVMFLLPLRSVNRVGNTSKVGTPSLSVNRANKLYDNYYCLWNACSLCNKLNSFQAFVYSKNFVIVAITETWLQDFIFDNKILPSNYTIYRNDRQSKGGGTIIAVNNQLSSKVVSTPDDLELTAMNLHQYQLTNCAVYISPNAPTEYHKKTIQLYGYFITQ